MTSGVLCDECEGEAQALNWACAAQLFRSLDAYGNPVDLVPEIEPTDQYAANDAQAAVREKVD
jgi:hypothetical protein